MKSYNQIYYEKNRERIRKNQHNNNRTIKSRYLYGKVKAKKRNIKFELSFEEYNKLLLSPCYYCGNELDEMGVGLDRINNDKSIGYTSKNVLPCCGRCNKTRGIHWTVEQTKAMIIAALKIKV